MTDKKKKVKNYFIEPNKKQQEPFISLMIYYAYYILIQKVFQKISFIVDWSTNCVFWPWTAPTVRW